MSDKQLVVELLNRLPEDAKLADISRAIEFLAAIREGEAQADCGEVVHHEQVKREFQQYFGDYTRERQHQLQGQSIQSVAARIRARKEKRT